MEPGRLLLPFGKLGFVQVAAGSLGTSGNLAKEGDKSPSLPGS